MTSIGGRAARTILALCLTCIQSAASAQTFGVTQTIEGACVEGSRIAEGPANVDLASFRSAYFCSHAIVSEPGPGRRLVQFLDRGSFRETLVAFALERSDEPSVWNVSRVYFRSGVDTPAGNGMCIFNYKANKLASIMCGGRVVVQSRAAAVSVGFEVK